MILGSERPHGGKKATRRGLLGLASISINTRMVLLLHCAKNGKASRRQHRTVASDAPLTGDFQVAQSCNNKSQGN